MKYSKGADPENFQGGWLVSKSYNLGNRGESRLLPSQKSN